MMALKLFSISIALLSCAIYGGIKLNNFNNELARTVTHHTHIVSSRSLDLGGSSWPASVAAKLLHSDIEYQVFEDVATKSVPASALKHRDESTLLTLYLRHTLAKFTSLPQAYILWLMANQEGRKSFDKSYISGLSFEAGDLLANTYTVVHRDPAHVEFLLSLGDQGDISYVEGRLLIGISVDPGTDVATFTTRTLMWRRMDAGTLMPMERTVPRWAHKTASMWLINTGVKSVLKLPSN